VQFGDIENTPMPTPGGEESANQRNKGKKKIHEEEMKQE